MVPSSWRAPLRHQPVISSPQHPCGRRGGASTGDPPRPRTGAGGAGTHNRTAPIANSKPCPIAVQRVDKSRIQGLPFAPPDAELRQRRLRTDLPCPRPLSGVAAFGAAQVDSRLTGPFGLIARIGGPPHGHVRLDVPGHYWNWISIPLVERRSAEDARRVELNSTKA